MNVDELPESEVLTLTADTRVLGDALNKIQHAFSCFEPVFGGPRSGRILYQYWSKNAASFPSQNSADELARTFLHQFRLEARYDPPMKDGHNKGFEVHKADVNGQHVAIVWAAWVPVGK